MSLPDHYTIDTSAWLFWSHVHIHSCHNCYSNFYISSGPWCLLTTVTHLVTPAISSLLQKTLSPTASFYIPTGWSDQLGKNFYATNWSTLVNPVLQANLLTKILQFSTEQGLLSSCRSCNICLSFPSTLPYWYLGGPCEMSPALPFIPTVLFQFLQISHQ